MHTIGSNYQVIRPCFVALLEGIMLNIKFLNVTRANRILTQDNLRAHTAEKKMVLDELSSASTSAPISSNIAIILLFAISTAGCRGIYPSLVELITISASTGQQRY